MVTPRTKNSAGDRRTPLNLVYIFKHIFPNGVRTQDLFIGASASKKSRHIVPWSTSCLEIKSSDFYLFVQPYKLGHNYVSLTKSFIFREWVYGPQILLALGDNGQMGSQLYTSKVKHPHNE